MSGFARHRRELFWAALLAALAVFGPRYAPGQAPGSDTWSVRPGGKKVFFEVAQGVLGDVRRHAERLLPPPEGRTLCILGPARYPDAGEWRRLHEWVSAGHVLVFAARHSDPVVDLGPFGLRVRPGGGEAAPLEAHAALGVRVAGPWRGAWIDGRQAEDWIALHAAGRPVAMVQKVGGGVLVAVASDEFFENAWVVRRGQGLVGLRLVEWARAEGAVFVDESLNESGTRIFGLLLSHAVRPLTLQLVAVLLLFGWSGCRLFGAPLGPARPARRNIAEHARALGEWHRRAGTGAALAAAHLEHVRHRLGLGSARVAPADAAEHVARRARLDPERVRAAFARAGRAAASRRADGAAVALAIRGLAEIHSAVRQVHRGRSWS